MIDRAWACLAASIFGLVVATTDPAAAQPAPIDARVVWVRDARVYLVTPDSLAPGDGARLTFVFRGRTIATGEVARIAGDGMVIARLTSGSLPREEDLKRVRILSEPAPGPRSLRVGYPSPTRSTLFFACERLALTPPSPPGSYRADSSGHALRLVSDSVARAGVSWPETLTIQRFDEVADEEIALERGEVDVAVFWPGELSSHMREPPRGLERTSALMPRGCVAALEMASPIGDAAATSLIDDSLLTALNRELFRGDLDERWHEPGSALPGPVGPGASRGPRYEVDPACPGRAALERFLARQGPPPAHAERPLVRLVFLDCAPGAPDSIAAAAARYRRLDATSRLPAPRVQPVFAFACSVLVDARLGSYLRALGAGAILGLFDCGARGVGP
jgi:hypothetical protein